MNKLDQIVKNKTKEVELKKSILPLSYLEKSALFNRETFSLKNNLTQSKSGIIAEHKRRSPSKSIINQNLSVQEVVQGYEKAGASAISVLTDIRYFGGSIEDLLISRSSVDLPLLRKDFTIDPYQILEAKAFGADCILLIAAILTKKKIIEFSRRAKDLGLEIILEIHDENELENSINPSIDIIGINNRNLKTFEVSIETSKELSRKIPSEFVKISESGISETNHIKELKTFGFQGFLMGENFMKTENPGKTAAEFIQKIQHES